jgi:hypothetical protein
MKYRYAFLALLAVACLAAVPARAADVVYPPGSKLGIVPPAGFDLSGTVRGFEDRQNKAAILLLEMPPLAFPEIEKAMTADALKKQGVAVAFREPITLKDGKGFLIAGRQVVDGIPLRKWILVGSTPDVTALVTALVPDDAKSVYPDSAVRGALSSLEIRADIPADELLSLLPFKLNDLGGFRPFRVEAASIFLTDGPKNTIDTNEQPLLVVSAAPGGPAEAPQRDNFARNLLAGLPGLTDVRIISTDLIRLGGIQTHQLLAEAKDVKTGTDIKVVQWLRFGNGAYVRFLGMARGDAWLDAFTRFRTVRDGLGTR